MLAFFRKHEKGFFLLLFLPTIVGLGVTSVIASVLTREQSHFHPTFFGQEYTPADWEKVVVPYKKTNRDASNNDEHVFFAQWVDAEATRIKVSDDKVAQGIVDDMSMDMARMRAQERMIHEHIDPQSDEGRRIMVQYFIEEIQNNKKNFSEADYKDALKMNNLSVQEYEGHQKRAHAIKELLALAEMSVSVKPDEVWKAFRDKRHTREAEVVALEAQAYVPSPSATGNDPAAVTDAQVDAYYKKFKNDYDEPRRVSLEFVAAPFKEAKKLISEPDEATVHDFYEKHPHEFEKNVAPVGSAEVMVVSSYTDAGIRDKAHDLLVDQLAQDRAQSILEEVAARLDQQRAAGAKAVSIADATSNTQAIVVGQTSLRTSDEIKTAKWRGQLGAAEKANAALLKGFASYRWAEGEGKSETRTSDPLKAEEAVVILRTANVTDKKTPLYKDIKDRVRTDYLQGGELETKDFFGKNVWKYRLKDRYEVIFLKALWDEFAKKPAIADRVPSKVDLDGFFANPIFHDTLWPGKKREEVTDDDITRAWKAELAKPEAKTVLQQIHEGLKKTFEQKHAIDLSELKHVKTSTEGSSFCSEPETLTLDPDSIAKTPYKDVKLQIATMTMANLGEPCLKLENLSDGSGMFIYVVTKKTEQRVPELDEEIDGKKISDQVRKDLLLERGMERAQAAADKLILELRDLRGDALAQALAKKGLKAQRTGFFAASDHDLVNPCGGHVAAQIIASTFTCEVEGGFERSVSDPSEMKADEARVFLVRCAARQDPKNEEMKPAVRDAIRTELLDKKREAFKQNWTTERLLKAKGIAKEHVHWVRERRDGPNGEVARKIRQIYIPNDPATIDGWLEKEAWKRLDEAYAALKANEKWEDVVSKFSEDEGTKLTGGQVKDVARGEVSRVYGADFEARLFELPKGAKERIRSKLGVHLVEVTQAAQTPRQDPHSRRPALPRMSFQHILVKTDAKLRNLPADVEAKAREISKKNMSDAVARLDAGEPFAQVAAEVAQDQEDARSKGEPFSLDYASPAVLMALRQPLDPADPDLLVPEEIAAGNAKEWHLQVCERDPLDKEPAFKALPRSPRLAYELVGTKADMDHAKSALADWKKQCREKGVEIDFRHLLHEWKKLCERHSKGASKAKEGAFGYVSIDQTVRDWPEDFLASVFATPPGKRTAVCEAKDGFRIVEVVSIETKPADDTARERAVADLVLRGTDWNDGDALERSSASVPAPDFGGWGD